MQIPLRVSKKALDARADWVQQARPAQLPPTTPWINWLLQAGRGYGKTRPGAEETWWYAFRHPDIFYHVIAPTRDDVRLVCFEGPSGILSLMPSELIIKNGYNKQLLMVELINGAIIRGFSAQEPSRLRGPQCHRLWADELAAWADGQPQDTWDMAMLGLRLGNDTRTIATTTPRPIALIRKLNADPNTVVTRGATHENRANLSPQFYQTIAQYEGTKIGRQEIQGEVIDLEEDGIIRRSSVQLWPAAKPLPPFHFIVVSLDTAYTERTHDRKTGDSDYTAATVWGVFSPNPHAQYAHRDSTMKVPDQQRSAMLLDAWHDKIGLPELIVRTKKMMRSAYGPISRPLAQPLIGPNRMAGDGRKPDVLIIEDKGSGISLRQMLAQSNISAYRYNPGRADKLARLHVVSPIFAEGKVWVVESDKNPGQPRSWAEPVLEQLCTFRGGGSIPHDDYVDSTTQALRYLNDSRFLRRPIQVVDLDQYRQTGNPYAA